MGAGDKSSAIRHQDLRTRSASTFRSPNRYRILQVKSFKALIYRWISQKYMAGCSNYNSLQVRKASRSKKQARLMFEKHDLPHARGTLFFNPLTAHRFAKEHGFPLCIKPNVSGFSRGSHFPINNYRELWKACLLYTSPSPRDRTRSRMPSSA